MMAVMDELKSINALGIWCKNHILIYLSTTFQVQDVIQYLNLLWSQGQSKFFPPPKRRGSYNVAKRGGALSESLPLLLGAETRRERPREGEIIT